jgi:hypothetical protein
MRRFTDRLHISRAEKEEWRNTMNQLGMLVAAALTSTISTTPAVAQAAISEPGAFQAMFPNRDVLNGGELTRAGRMGLDLPGGTAGGYAANDAYAAMGTANPSYRVRRHHRYAPAADSFVGYDGSHYPSQ